MFRLVTTVTLLASIVGIEACIHQYGSLEEAKAIAGKDYGYAYNGLDWVNDFETCRGSKQSPVLLTSIGEAAKSAGPPAALSTFSYGTLIDPIIVNNGHTLQVAFPASYSSNMEVPIRGDKSSATGASILSGTGPVTGTVKATPSQFHFHTHSEHLVNGMQYPLELHIGHFIAKDQLPACGDAGCPAVLGIMLELTMDESEVKPELRRIIEAMPLIEKQSATINGSLNLNNIIPDNRTYFVYEGSQTHPPCLEGVLWHVLANPIKISQSLLTEYQEAVGDTMCDNATQSAHMKHMTESPQQPFQPPPSGPKGCHKLANGHNFRVVQPLNGRQVQLAVV